MKKPKLARQKKARRPIMESRYIGAAEANRMFALFCELHGAKKGLGFSAIARKFDRARTSVIRTAEEHKWEERYQELQKQVAAEVDKKVVRQEVSNLDIVRNLKKAVINELIQKVKAKSSLGVSVRDAIAIVAAEEELLDKMPDTGKDVETISPVLAEALEVLKQAGPRVIAAIGDLIVKGKIMDETVGGGGGA